MKPLHQILGAATSSKKIIALAEGDDPRVVEGALKARAEDAADIVLVGDQTKVACLLAEKGGSDVAGIEIHDPVASPHLDRFADAYFELRKHKGVTPETAKSLVQNRLNYAAMLVHLGLADGTVGGAVETTSDTVRAALQIIGKAPDAQWV